MTRGLRPGGAARVHAAPTTGGLGLQRLQISAAEGNAASHRVIVANGFVPDRPRAPLAAPGATAASSTALTYDLLVEEYAGTASAR